MLHPSKPVQEGAAFAFRCRRCTSCGLEKPTPSARAARQRRGRASAMLTAVPLALGRSRVQRPASLRLQSSPSWRKLVATADCQRGKVIWREAPLLVWHRGMSPQESAVNAIEAFADLRKDVQELVLTFHCPEATQLEVDLPLQERNRRLLSILQACCSGLPGGHAGLFEHVAYANHSCQPNAAIRVSGHTSGYGLRFVALRPIVAGEEITISYLRDSLLTQPVRSRQRHLRFWGFTCACIRCAAVCDDTRQIFCGKRTLASSKPGLLVWPTEDQKSMSFFQKLEGSWWRERAGARQEQEMAEDVRLRRFALGLGRQEWWRERGRRLRQNHWWSRTLRLHGRTRGSLHWLAAAVARDASESYLWRGQPELAIQAACEWRAFLESVSAGALSQEAALALEVQGAAVAMLGLHEKAALLYRQALQEYKPLHNDWDDDDFLMPYLNRQVNLLSGRKGWNPSESELRVCTGSHQSLGTTGLDLHVFSSQVPRWFAARGLRTHCCNAYRGEDPAILELLRVEWCDPAR